MGWWRLSLSFSLLLILPLALSQPNQDNQVSVNCTDTDKVESFLNVSMLRDLDEAKWLPVLRKRHIVVAPPSLEPAPLRKKRLTDDYSEIDPEDLEKLGDNDDEYSNAETKTTKRFSGTSKRDLGTTKRGYDYTDGRSGTTKRSKQKYEMPKSTTSTPTTIMAAPKNVVVLPIKPKVFKSKMTTTTKPEMLTDKYPKMLKTKVVEIETKATTKNPEITRTTIQTKVLGKVTRRRTQRETKFTTSASTTTVAAPGNVLMLPIKRNFLKSLTSSTKPEMLTNKYPKMLKTKAATVKNPEITRTTVQTKAVSKLIRVSTQKEPKFTMSTPTTIMATPDNVLMLPIKRKFFKLNLTTTEPEKLKNKYSKMLKTKVVTTKNSEMTKTTIQIQVVSKLTRASTRKEMIIVTKSTTPTKKTASTTVHTTTTKAAKILTVTNKLEEKLFGNRAQKKSLTQTPIVNIKKEDLKSVQFTRNKAKFPLLNKAPILSSHMETLVVYAGKLFKHSIPEDLFIDPEDGTNLSLSLYHENGTKVDRDFWMQLLPSEREIYGIPLESHVLKWTFVLEARDREGLSARFPLVVKVQRKKDSPIINHMFSVELELKHSFNKTLDWEVRALEGIVILFGDTSLENLTVLDVNRNADVCKLWWTNDTIPQDSMFCPMERIIDLWKVLSIPSGAPSPELLVAMRPDFAVTEVGWEGLGACERTPFDTSVLQLPRDYSPEIRNPIGTIHAMVGHLLVHKIAEDVFYDPEDGGTRKLHLSLWFSDGSEIPPDNWLQLNSLNQDLYGLPDSSNLGIEKYQLSVEDSVANKIYSSLTVQVDEAYPLEPTAEFRATMDYPFENLTYTENKRKALETIASLFGQRDTRDIKIVNITDGPTTIIWYNTSFRTIDCPKREIYELQDNINIFYVDHASNKYYDKKMKIMSLTIKPIGLCENLEVNAEAEAQMGFGRPYFMHNDETVAVRSLMSFVMPAMTVFSIMLILIVIFAFAYKRSNAPREEMSPRIRVYR